MSSRGMNVPNEDVLIITNPASISIASRTKEGTMLCIHLSSVNLQRQKSVLSTIDADEHIIESNVCTIVINTKLNFVTSFQTRLRNASMVITVLLLIQ